MDFNKNTSKYVLFAQQLIRITKDNPNLLEEDNLMRLERDIFSTLSTNEFVDCLRALDRRNVIEFENKEDFLNFPYIGQDFIWIYLYKENLYEFLRLANKSLYGLDLANKEKVLRVLKKLYLLIHAKFEKSNQIKIGKLKEDEFLEQKDIETIEWIADYSDFIKIIYELEADFETDELGRNIPVGAGEFPKKVEVVDIDDLKQFYENLKKELLLSEKKELKIIGLKNNIEWRCAKCSRFLDRLTNKEQIESYLVDFMIDKYKICHKCRRRNYFELNSNGQINFLMLQKDDN
jgi:hypothetical protein